MTTFYTIAAVVIGRNEGERLIRCLKSLIERVGSVVYVDSGSSDGSQDAARALGVDVVVLEKDVPFTAARARNAGVDHISKMEIPIEFIQFVDGDCEVREGWISTAQQFLEDTPTVAAVCGRRRERHPTASVYNGLIDSEWDTPVGLAKSCGGDVMMRLNALDQVGRYDPYLIAGEEPELCVRLRGAGWQIWRLDAEMTWHDAAITRFGQWWNRTRRAGHAYAEGAAMHGAAPEQHNVRPLRRALIWGCALPVLAVVGAIITPAAQLLLLAYPAQFLRLGIRTGDWVEAAFLVLGKFPETQGALGYWLKNFLGRRNTLIEYK
jgi:GT2 family glycosyltransferase